MSLRPAYPPELVLDLPEGLQVRRFAQVSNGPNSTALVANVVSVLPLIGDGTNNRNYNNPEGYCSVDLANDWFDVSNCDPGSGFIARVTVGNNNSGAVTNANIVLRLIPDKNHPEVYVDAPSFDVTFRTQSQFTVTAYHDGIEAVQIAMRTTTNENVRHFGTYLSVLDVNTMLDITP